MESVLPRLDEVRNAEDTNSLNTPWMDFTERLLNLARCLEQIGLEHDGGKLRIWSGLFAEMNGFLMFTTRPRPEFSAELWESLAVRYKRPKLPLTVAQVNKLRTEWFATARASASMMAKHLCEVRKDLVSTANPRRGNPGPKKSPKRGSPKRDTPTARTMTVYAKYLELQSMAETGKHFGISKAAVGIHVKKAKSILDKKGRSVKARRLPTGRRGEAII